MNENKEKYELQKEKYELQQQVIVAKDTNIKLLRDMLISKETEILGIQGLMSCRGIFEFYLNFCHGELKTANIIKKTDTFKATNIINWITSANFQIPEDSIWIRDFLNWLKECGCTNPLALYTKLCSGIHGAAWHGASVRIYRKKLLEVEYCVMEKMWNRLSVVLDDVKEVVGDADKD